MAFLTLFGVMHLIDTKIPPWVLGIVALASALALLVSGGWKKAA